MSTYPFSCPNCDQVLEAGDEHLGMVFNCPTCDSPLQVPTTAAELIALSQPEPAPAPPPSSVPPVPSSLTSTSNPYLAPEPSTAFVGSSFPNPHAAPVPTVHPQGSYKVYAQREGIDLSFSPGQDFPNEETANLESAFVHDSIPEQPSAYQPSGKVSASAVTLLPLGLVLSFLGGLTQMAKALVILGAIGVVIWLAYQVMFHFGVVYVWPFLTIIGILLAYGYLFYAVGAGAGQGSCWYSRLTKNRNNTITVWVAILGSLVTIVALRSVLIAGLHQIPTGFTQDAADFTARNAWYNWLIFGVGAVVALLIAASSGTDAFRDSKFCETCNRFLKSKRLKKVSFGQTQVLARLAEEQRMDAIVDYLPQMEGEFAEVNLHQCKGCHCGYLEVDVDWKYKFMDQGGGNSRRDRWRVASLPLEAQYVETLEQA